MDKLIRCLLADLRDRRKIRALQSTGFVLNPGGQAVVSVYSSGATGRLVPGDVTGLIGYLRAHATSTGPPGSCAVRGL
jgi:hypothetical protein